MKYLSFVALFALLNSVYAKPYLPAEYYDPITCQLIDVNKNTQQSQEVIHQHEPYVGIPLNRNKKLISYDKFMNSLEVSLGEYISDRSRWAEREGIDNSLVLNELNGILKIIRDNRDIYNVSYSTLDLKNILKKGYHINNNEMLAMLEVINIFIDDKEKSSELLEELYERYIGQISMIEQGSVIAFLEYDGMYFSMSGTKIAFHPLEQCNGSYLYGIYIE